MIGPIRFSSGASKSISFDMEKGQINVDSRTEYKSAFNNWDDKASVRSSPNHVEYVDNFCFPEALVPIVRHPIVEDLGAPANVFLRQAALSSFLNFTHHLEISFVNIVTANIALGRYSLSLPQDSKIDAHRIYVDESYHALCAYEMMVELRSEVPTNYADKFQVTTPEFVYRLENLLAEVPGDQQAFVEFLFVVVSELLITATLGDKLNIPGTNPRVRELLKDHARDESRHHAFYRNFLYFIWPEISRKNRLLLYRLIPRLLIIYNKPDVTTILNDLQTVGLDVKQAERVCQETFCPSTTTQYAIDCGHSIYSAIRELAHPNEYKILEEETMKVKLDQMQRAAVA